MSGNRPGIVAVRINSGNFAYYFIWLQSIVHDYNNSGHQQGR